MTSNRFELGADGDMEWPSIGSQIILHNVRSRWAILWDRIRHPFTTPARIERVPHTVIGSALGTPFLDPFKFQDERAKMQPLGATFTFSNSGRDISFETDASTTGSAKRTPPLNAGDLLAEFNEIGGDIDWRTFWEDHSARVGRALERLAELDPEFGTEAP